MLFVFFFKRSKLLNLWHLIFHIDNDIIYLWVYKENVQAISLYKKLGFNVIEETESRYYMKYSK